VHVLKTRETKIIEQINGDFSSSIGQKMIRLLSKVLSSKNLREMIISTNLMLEIKLAQKNILNLPFELEK
tara:strand:+ start:33853 stop:34062 length:210 start_codon:yes stop_codon:yes gene_type:complete